MAEKRCPFFRSLRAFVLAIFCAGISGFYMHEMNFDLTDNEEMTIMFLSAVIPLMIINLFTRRNYKD